MKVARVIDLADREAQQVVQHAGDTRARLPIWQCGSQVKRYQRGTSRNIWEFEQGAEEAVLLTDQIVGESHAPY